MKLYRAKIPVIAQETVQTLVQDGDIEVTREAIPEAVKDLVAIMEEYLRRDDAFRNQVKDHMSTREIPFDQYGSIRTKISDETQHPVGDDVERFLARQFIENMLISKFVDEVYAEDKVIYKKIVDILRGHHVNEAEIRAEAVDKIKNVKEGTVEYEIALQKAVRDVKKRKGLA